MPVTYGHDLILFENSKVMAYLNITGEGSKRTRFGHEHRSPYRIGFSFLGEKGIHETIKVSSISIYDSKKNQIDLINSKSDIVNNFWLWKNDNWGVDLKAHRVFDIDFFKNPIISVKLDGVITAKGEEHSFQLIKEFESKVDKAIGFHILHYPFYF